MATLVGRASWVGVGRQVDRAYGVRRRFPTKVSTCISTRAYLLRRPTKRKARGASGGEPEHPSPLHSCARTRRLLPGEGRGWKCEWMGGGGTTVGRWAVGTGATGAAGHRRRGDNTLAHATPSARACEACVTSRNASRQPTSGALQCATPLGCRKRTSAMRRFSTFFLRGSTPPYRAGRNKSPNRPHACRHVQRTSEYPPSPVGQYRPAAHAGQSSKANLALPGGDTRNSTAQGQVNGR